MKWVPARTSVGTQKMRAVLAFTAASNRAPAGPPGATAGHTACRLGGGSALEWRKFSPILHATSSHQTPSLPDADPRSERPRRETVVTDDTEDCAGKNALPWAKDCPLLAGPSVSPRNKPTTHRGQTKSIRDQGELIRPDTSEPCAPPLQILPAQHAASAAARCRWITERPSPFGMAA